MGIKHFDDGNENNISRLRDPQLVFVVHGRDEYARHELFKFLESIDLKPMEFEEARKAHGVPSAPILEIVDTAFSLAQAIIVLITPDDEAKLRDEFHRSREEPHERELTPQPRLNVVFEAGMAYGFDKRRTILVRIGELNRISDLDGHFIQELNNSQASREQLIRSLEIAGCQVDPKAETWLEAGNFETESVAKRPPTEIFHPETSITPNDVVNAFTEIPDFSKESVQKRKQILYLQLTYNHIRNREQLYDLVRADAILGTLRQMYIEELLRDGPLPLDPEAVSTWGATLFINGNSPEAIKHVRQQLRQSDEYRRKHGLVDPKE